MEDSYLGLLHDDPYSEYNYYVSQVYVPAGTPGPSTVQFVHPYANRPKTLCMQTTGVRVIVACG